MTRLEITIEQASAIAYEDNSNQIVGRVDGEWVIADEEDEGRLNEMGYPRFVVDAGGVSCGLPNRTYESATR